MPWQVEATEGHYHPKASYPPQRLLSPARPPAPPGRSARRYRRAPGVHHCARHARPTPASEPRLVGEAWCSTTYNSAFKVQTTQLINSSRRKHTISNARTSRLSSPRCAPHSDGPAGQVRRPLSDRSRGTFLKAAGFVRLAAAAALQTVQLLEGPGGIELKIPRWEFKQAAARDSAMYGSPDSRLPPSTPPTAPKPNPFGGDPKLHKSRTISSSRETRFPLGPLQLPDGRVGHSEDSEKDAATRLQRQQTAHTIDTNY